MRDYTGENTAIIEQWRSALLHGNTVGETRINTGEDSGWGLLVTTLKSCQKSLVNNEGDIWGTDNEGV